jgi:hypothetical protein
MTVIKLSRETDWVCHVDGVLVLLFGADYFEQFTYPDEFVDHTVIRGIKSSLDKASGCYHESATE